MTDVAKATDSNTTLTIDQQNDVSAKAIAGKFLDDVAGTLKADAAAVKAGGDYLGAMFGNDIGAFSPRKELASLQNDPMKDQVLKQIATDMSDASTMQTLGISGSVLQDKSGNITGFSFADADGQAAYRSDIYSRERNGETPTQAVSSFDREHLNIPEFHGESTINANGK